MAPVGMTHKRSAMHRLSEQIWIARDCRRSLHRQPVKDGLRECLSYGAARIEIGTAADESCEFARIRRAIDCIHSRDADIGRRIKEQNFAAATWKRPGAAVELQTGDRQLLQPEERD